MDRPIRTVPHKRSSSGATETYEFNCTIEKISRFRSDNPLNDAFHMYAYMQYGYVLTFFTRPDEVTPGDKKPAEFVLRFDPGDFHCQYFEFIFMVSPLSLRATPSLEILFTQSVVKANGEKRALASKEKLSGPGKTKVTRIGRAELFNPVNGFVTKDSITLHHEVIIRNKSDQLQHEDSQLEPLAKSFGDLLQSGAHSDVTFVLVDDGGEELRAHKAILAARSQMFADMFALCTADSSPDPIEIVKTRVAVFKQALNYIYTDQVSGPLDGTAQDLLICADKYQLDSLKSICEDYLVGSITVESDLLELHELAERINAPKLQAKVENLVRNSDIGGLLSKMSQMKRQLSSLEAAAAAYPKTKKSKRSN